MEKKNFVWNLIGSLLNAFTSLFFMIIVTRINGVDKAGVFTFAFSLATMLQVIATYHGRPYQVTDKTEELSDVDFLRTRTFTSLIMLFVSLIYIFIKKYNFEKSIMILLFIIFRGIEAISDAYYGIMQKNDKLYNVGISLTLKAIVGVLLFLIIDLFTKNIILSIISLIVTQVLFFTFYDINKKKNMCFTTTNFSFKKIKKIIVMGFSIFIVSILSQYLLQAPKFPIDSFLSNDKQTIYGIISMPATMMVLASQFIIHPFLVKMNNHLVKNDYMNFKKMVIKLCLILFGFGIVCELLLYVMGIPLLNLVYGIKLEKYIIELLVIAFGALLFGISTIISYSMIAMNKNRVQSIIFIISSIISYILSYKLVYAYGLMGAALSYFIIMLLILLLYVISFNFYMKKVIK